MEVREWAIKSIECEGRRADGYAYLCEISKHEGFESSVHSIYCDYNFCDRRKLGRDWHEGS